MSEIKYFKELTQHKLDELITEAMSKATHIDQMNGLKSLEDTPLDRDEIVKAFRELTDKPEPTKFEAKWLMLMRRHLRSGIELAGDS